MFVPRRSDCSRLQLSLKKAFRRGEKCYVYNSAVAPDVRKKIFEAWSKGESTACDIIVAASALSCGIDVKSVRLVVNYANAYSLVGFAQESGRAGRDEKVCKSLVLSRWPKSLWTNKKRLGNMDSFVFSRSCRRTVLDSFLGGGSVGPCYGDEEYCDN